MSYRYYKRFLIPKVTFKLTQGHQQSCHSIADIWFPIFFRCNYVSILHHFWDIIAYFGKDVTWPRPRLFRWKWPILTYPTCIIRISPWSLASENYPGTIVRHYLRVPTFSRYRTVTHRHTHTHTHTHARGRHIAYRHRAVKTRRRKAKASGR